MGEALLWGLAAGSSLVLGALLTFALRPRPRAVGLLMGFGAGTLISAVSYELVSEAFATAGSSGGWLGLAAGSLAYFFGSRAIGDRDEDAGGLVLGSVLDGIPEGIVLGMSLIGGGGGSAAMIGAVFMSNLPEAVGATRDLDGKHGMSRRRQLLMWGAIAVATGIASVVGFSLFDTASADVIAFIQAFAAGALLTMVANTMLPKAHRAGTDLVGLMTVLGFAVAFALAELA